MNTTILHVDDQPELPEGVAQALRRDGYELLQTSDPEEAIRLVEEREPALVLMELEPTGFDGLDLLAGIRSPQRGSVPVLVLTRAARHSALHGEAIALGVVDFLSKPVLASQLLTSIRELAPPVPKAPKARPADATPPPGSTGSLSDAPLPELLARLRRRRATGVLIASLGPTQLGVQLRNGAPIALDAGRRGASRRDGSRAASEEEIDSLLAQEAESTLFAAFGWTHGSYRFAEGRRLKSKDVIEVARETGSLLLAGVLEASSLEQVRKRLRAHASLYVSTTEGCAGALESVELPPWQARRLSDLDGQDTLGELLEANAFEEKLLYGLWVAGALEFDATPTLTLTSVLAGIETEAVGEPARTDTAAPRASGPEAIAETLRELAQRVMADDDFEALDIPLFAPDSQVRGSYERILQEIPEEALSSADPELRGRAARIRARVEAAYENLRDPETRRAYALLRKGEQLEPNAKAPAERSIEASRWFRKGERSLKGRRYAQAAEAFGMASHLDPNEGEYLAHLGYALYLSKPSDTVVQREAMEHVANAIKRSPMREISYLYLGRILRGKGETDSARKVFRKALRIQPKLHAARQELRLLELREKKGKGILARLWRR